jgi:hypothetical protein
MKKITYLIVFFFFIFIGCNKSYIQVFDTKSSNVKIENEFYVYETDTLKITYSFWAEKGIMSFAIFNKLDIPIYIDWKKSSYIDNSKKLNYWIDEEHIKSASYYGSYFYKGAILKPVYTVNEGIGATTTIRIKMERLTFMPPKSNYYRSQFYLLPLTYYKLNKKTEYKYFNRNDNPKKNTKVYEANYSKNDSPLVFRNFIAFSLTEDFKEEFYIDNEFYISNIKEMDHRHFKYKVKDINGKYVYIKPFKKNTSFYLNIHEYQNIENRKNYNTAIRGAPHF